MASRQKNRGQKFTDSLDFFLLPEIQVTKADIRRVIPVDRPRKADAGGGSCSSLESLQLESLAQGLCRDMVGLCHVT